MLSAPKRVKKKMGTHREHKALRVSRAVRPSKAHTICVTPYHLTIGNQDVLTYTSFTVLFMTQSRHFAERGTGPV